MQRLDCYTDRDGTIFRVGQDVYTIVNQDLSDQLPDITADDDVGGDLCVFGWVGAHYHSRMYICILICTLSHTHRKGGGV